ncbi:MAG: hypothetical protein CBD58_04820 [bacterium TMED198]|nr:MAG: hypothetical protein CBD58_04820 [bacterium TMED198]
MLKIATIFFCISFLLSFTADDLVESMNSKVKPKDIESELTMVLTNKKGRVKTSKLKTVSSKNSEKQIIWFLEPRKDRGIALLKVEHQDKSDEMRMWLPAFKKIRRITSNKKAGSFMGSDLSYEDLYTREIQDYKYSMRESEEVDGMACHVLVSVPNKELLSEYSKHLSWIDKNSLLPVKEESYDKDDKLLKKKEVKYAKIGKYSLIKEIYVENVQKKHSTLLKFDNFKVDRSVEDGFFNESKLKRIPK